MKKKGNASHPLAPERNERPFSELRPCAPRDIDRQELRGCPVSDSDINLQCERRLLENIVDEKIEADVFFSSFFSKTNKSCLGHGARPDAALDVADFNAQRARVNVNAVSRVRDERNNARTRKKCASLVEEAKVRRIEKTKKKEHATSSFLLSCVPFSTSLTSAPFSYSLKNPEQEKNDIMDSTLSLAPWELPPLTGAEAAGLADLRAMLAELSDASLARILFGEDAAADGDGGGGKNNSKVGEPPCCSYSVVAEARRAGELDALLQKHLSDVSNVERLAWSCDGGAGGKASPPSTVNVVASARGGREAAPKAHSDSSCSFSSSPRSSIARWWANRKTAIGRKGRKIAKEAAAAAAKETHTTTTTSSPAAAIIFAREAAVALSSSDAGVAGAAAWAVTRWLSLHPAHWRALLDAGCVVPLVELLMNNSSSSSGSLSALAAAMGSNAAAAANASATPTGGGGAPVPASAAGATTWTAAANSSNNNLHDDDAPAAACAALALRAIASSGPDAQAAAAAAGVVGAAVDALEAVEDDGLWTGLAAVEEEEEEEGDEKEGDERGEERQETAAATTENDNAADGKDDGSCSSPRSPSSFPSPPQLSSSFKNKSACSKREEEAEKKRRRKREKKTLLAHRRAQQEALASLIGALTAGNEAVALAATAAGCLPRLLALLSPSRNYSPALAACALFSLQPLAEVPAVRARFLLMGSSSSSTAAAAAAAGGNSKIDSKNPVALVTASLPRLLAVSGATRAAAMLLLSLLEERGGGGGGEEKERRERESERRVFLRWMAEVDTPGELVRALRPWTEEGGGGPGSSSSSAPSTPLSSKEKETQLPRLTAATVAAVCSALAALARSGDRPCAALISAAGGVGVLRGVTKRASTAPSAARSARAALEALGEREDDDFEDDDDVDDGKEAGEVEQERRRAEAKEERSANYFL